MKTNNKIAQEIADQITFSGKNFLLQSDRERAVEIIEKAMQESAVTIDDARSLLSFQEMHKSAELIKDRERMECLLKNSCIIIGGIYLTSRETIDAEISTRKWSALVEKKSQTTSLKLSVFVAQPDFLRHFKSRD